MTKIGDTHFTNADITHNLATFEGGLDVAARKYADGRDLKLLDQSDLMRIEVDVRGSQQVLCVAVLAYVEVAMAAVECCHWHGGWARHFSTRGG